MPMARRHSIDRDRAADSAVMLAACLAGYEEASRHGALPNERYLSRHAFQQMLFFMRIAPAAQEIPTLDDIIDEAWDMPYTTDAVVTVLRDRIEWGPPDWSAGDQAVLHDFVARDVAGSGGMTVKAVLHLVFFHNSAFPKPKSWALDLPEDNAGRTTAGELRKRDADPTVTAVLARLEPTPVVPEAREALAELRNVAHRILNGEPMANGRAVYPQVVPVHPAVLLGVAATFEYLWNTPWEQLPEHLVNVDGHMPFHRIAAATLELFDPAMADNTVLRNATCHRCFEHLSERTRTFFTRLEAT